LPFGPKGAGNGEISWVMRACWPWVRGFLPPPLARNTRPIAPRLRCPGDDQLPLSATVARVEASRAALGGRTPVRRAAGRRAVGRPERRRVARLQTQVARQEIDRTLKAFPVGELTRGIDGGKHHHHTFTVLFAKEPDIFPVLIIFKEPLCIKCDGKKGIRLKIHERLRPPDRIGVCERDNSICSRTF